jgi:hypothetical protein
LALIKPSTPLLFLARHVVLRGVLGSKKPLAQGSSPQGPGNRAIKKEVLATAVVGAADGLAAGLAAPGAFVFGQVFIETGKAAEGSAAGWAVVLWLKFVIVAEHRGGDR